MRVNPSLWFLAVILVHPPAAFAGSATFVNWESAQIHPLDMTPDGARLLPASTADNRLLVFDLTGPVPALISDVPVGLDPVSVRARTLLDSFFRPHH